MDIKSLCNDIDECAGKYCNNYNSIAILVGDFEQFGGSYCMNAKDVQKIEKKLIEKIKYNNNKYTENNKIYRFNNMSLKIDQKKQKKYLSEQTIFSKLYKSAYIELVNQKNITEETFPIVDKYDEAINQAVTKYVYGKNNQLVVSFIEEKNSSDDTINYIKINYKKNGNINTLESILTAITI